MSAIFISHSSSDNELAAEVARRLAERHHASVFLDFDPEQGIVGGQSWERTLYRKLRACRLVIALCTDAYLRSHWCFAEIALARMQGKPILALQAPSLAAGAQLPSILTEKQFIDLRRDPDEGWRRFWRALDALDLAGVAGEWDPSQPPYLGLSAYQEEHAPVFFGREDETLAGVELLERGAPGVIMVLGASGSGKSSLARAGIVPRLRSAPERWLVVDPFRPGRDPDAELVESLVRAFARYARDHVAEAGGLERIRAQLRDALEAPAGGDDRGVDALEAPGADGPQPEALAAPGADGPQPEPLAAPGADGRQTDERLQRLVELLERLRDDPPASLPPRLRNHLAWSLDDLLRLSGPRRIESAAPPGAAAAASPLMDIAEQLRRVAGQRSARVLIVVDQFEELLGHADGSPTPSPFLAHLRAAVEAAHSPVMVLATMRSDFLAPFQRHPSLQGIDFESLSLGPMRVDGMQRVIRMPARLAALEIEDGLTERLLADTGTPDALPLLSFTLWVMYRDRRDAGRLELAEYERLGGLQGTISREADAVREAALRSQREDDLRIALLQLARLTEDGSYARRPADWDQPEIARARDILEQLVDRRVLVSRVEGGTAVVEVAHEALFRTWTPLRTWLDNARADLLLRRQLDRDASAWRDGGRAPDLLWRGGRLLQAREVVGRHTRGSGDPASEFVQAGMRRRRTVQGIAVGITLVAFGILAGFLWYALDQADQARRQEARAV